MTIPQSALRLPAPFTQGSLKVKTTGVAGGLHKPYKGVGQPRLKAHEKVRQSQHYYGLPPYRGRLFICPCLLAHP